MTVLSKFKYLIFFLVSASIGALATVFTHQFLISPDMDERESSIIQGATSFRLPELKITLEPENVDSSCGNVMVWKSTVVPKNGDVKGLPLHRHNHARFLIPLSDGTLQRVDADGTTTDYSLKKGEAFFLSEDTADGFHTDEAIGENPLEMVVVQFNKEPPLTVEKLTEEELKNALVSK